MSWLRLCSRQLLSLILTPQPSTFTQIQPLTLTFTQIHPMTSLLPQIQPVRGYRKSKEIHPEGGRKWMVDVLKKTKQPMNKASLELMARKLQYLEDKGCKSYQIMEYPAALLLSEDEIVECVERLEKLDITPISIPLLKIAQNPRSLESRLTNYLKKRNGYCSLPDFLKSTLQCNDDELMDMLDSNPRLLSLRSVQDFKEKVNILLEHGASIQDIRRQSNVLKNRTVATIRARSEELSACGFNDPLPVTWIAQADSIYSNILRNYRASLQDQQEKSDFLDKELHMDKNALPASSAIIKQTFRTLKPKIDFLVSKGFDVQSLVNERILEKSLKTIKDTWETLEAHGIDDITPAILLNFAVSKRILHRPKIGRQLAGVTDNLKPKIPRKMRQLLHLQKREVLIENYKFLQECGFSKEHIEKMVIILGHDPQILRKEWTLLPQQEELFPFESWMEDKWKLLNLLQFYIEKEANFSQPIVFGNMD